MSFRRSINMSDLCTVQKLLFLLIRVYHIGANLLKFISACEKLNQDFKIRLVKTNFYLERYSIINTNQ